MDSADGFAEIVEGRTRLLVPGASLNGAAPPRDPAFFNPAARANRDYSMVAYAAFLGGFKGSRVLLEALGGVGARGIRAANEVGLDSLVINDLNPSAIELARRSAGLNHVGAEFSQDEACRFLAGRARVGRRGAIVDIDPFGSPVSFLDCGIRATMHGGMLAVAATDLQVLHGLFPDACKRKYGGVPTRTEYGSEVAVRLILGCMGAVAGRLDASISPLCAQSDRHYYRVYAKVSKKPGGGPKLGFITHCTSCGQRESSPEGAIKCRLCGACTEAAGPLWIGAIFDGDFMRRMLAEAVGLGAVDGCKTAITKGLAEAGMPAAFYAVDQISKRTGKSPPKLAILLERLRDAGFASSPTVFSPTGFKTDASAQEIEAVFSSIR